MNNWLREVELEGEHVRLIPMRHDHAEALGEAASDGNLWELWFTSVPSPESASQFIEVALEQNSRGVGLPFVVLDRKTQEVIGSTRYMNIDPSIRRLEIGHTWYAARYQRTAVNTECKRLLLEYAFEHLDCMAVEFRTHWHNHRSRNAIARLGAKQDGVLRNHLKDKDDCYRDTVVFSIIESEWPTVKKSLDFKLSRNDS